MFNIRRTRRAEFQQQKFQNLSQRCKVIQRHVIAGSNVKSTRQFTKQLSLLDAVDAKFRFKIRIKLNHLFRVSGLLDNEFHKDRLQLTPVDV